MVDCEHIHSSYFLGPTSVIPHSHVFSFPQLLDRVCRRRSCRGVCQPTDIKVKTQKSNIRHSHSWLRTFSFHSNYLFNASPLRRVNQCSHIRGQKENDTAVANKSLGHPSKRFSPVNVQLYANLSPFTPRTTNCLNLASNPEFIIFSFRIST